MTLDWFQRPDFALHKPLPIAQKYDHKKYDHGGPLNVWVLTLTGHAPPLNRIPLAMSSSLESNFKKTSIIHEEIQIVNKHIGKRFYSP